jgi:hypothetical protein
LRGSTVGLAPVPESEEATRRRQKNCRLPQTELLR